MDDETYYKLVLKLARQTVKTSTTCEPFFAGSRTSIEQPTGAFSGMNLATSREEMLTALIQSLAKASAERVTHLRKVTPHKVLTDVLRTGGAGKVLGAVMYKSWPSYKTPWRFADVPEATVMGLGRLAMGERV